MIKCFRSFRAGAAALLFSVLPAGMAHAALLDPMEIDASRLLPPPPLAGSAKAKDEVAELHAIMTSASAPLVEQARRDDGDE